MTNTLDIALAVEAIYPPDSADGAARFLEAGSYERLVATWSDERPVPTETELESAWQQVQANQAAAQQTIQERDAMPLFTMTVEEIETWADAQDEVTFKREMVKAFVHLRELVLPASRHKR